MPVHAGGGPFQRKFGVEEGSRFATLHRDPSFPAGKQIDKVAQTTRVMLVTVGQNIIPSIRFALHGDAQSKPLSFGGRVEHPRAQNCLQVRKIFSAKFSKAARQSEETVASPWLTLLTATSALVIRPEHEEIKTNILPSFKDGTHIYKFDALQFDERRLTTRVMWFTNRAFATWDDTNCCRIAASVLASH